MITEWKEAKAEDVLELIEKIYKEEIDSVVEVQLPFPRSVGVWASKFFGVSKYLPIEVIDKFVFESIVKELRNLRDLTASTMGDPRASEFSYKETLKIMVESEYPGYVFDCLCKEEDTFNSNLFLVNNDKENLKIIYKSPFITNLEDYFDMCKNSGIDDLITEDFIKGKIETSRVPGSTSICTWYFKKRGKRYVIPTIPETKQDFQPYSKYRLWDSDSFINFLKNFENENTNSRLKHYVNLFNNSEDFKLC